MAYVHYRTGREPFQYEKMNADPSDPNSKQTRAKRAIKRDIDGLFKYRPQIFKVPTHKQILKSCQSVKERPMFEDTVIVTLDDILKVLPPDTAPTVAIKKFAQAYLTDPNPPALSLYFGQFIQRSVFTDAFERRHPKNAGATTKEECVKKKMKVTTAYNNNEAIFIKDTYDGKVLLLRKKIISSQCLMEGCFRQKMHAWHPYGRFDTIPAEDDQHFIHAFSQNSRPSLMIDRALVSSKTPHICHCSDFDHPTMLALQSIYKDKPIHVGSPWRLIIDFENPGDGVMVRMGPEAAGGHAKALKLRRHGVLPVAFSKAATSSTSAYPKRGATIAPPTPPPVYTATYPKRASAPPPPTPPKSAAPAPVGRPRAVSANPPAVTAVRAPIVPAKKTSPTRAFSNQNFIAKQQNATLVQQHVVVKAPQPVAPNLQTSLDDLLAAAEATGDLKAAGLVDTEPTPPEVHPPPAKRIKLEAIAPTPVPANGNDELTNYFASLNQKLYAELQTLVGIPSTAQTPVATPAPALAPAAAPAPAFEPSEVKL